MFSSSSQSNQIYRTDFAFIIAGETSVGKTKTLNSFVSSIVEREVELYTSHKVDSTKIPTIVHFVEANKAKVEFKGSCTEYNTLEELLTWYNTKSNDSIYVELKDIIELYIILSRLPQHFHMNLVP